MTIEQAESARVIIKDIDRFEKQKAFLSKQIYDLITSTKGKGDVLKIDFFYYPTDLSISIYQTLIKHLDEELKKLTDRLAEL